MPLFPALLFLVLLVPRLLYDPETRDIPWVQQSRKKQEEWRDRQLERALEIRERRQRQASKLSEIQPRPVEPEKL